MCVPRRGGWSDKVVRKNEISIKLLSNDDDGVEVEGELLRYSEGESGAKKHHHNNRLRRQ